MDIRRTRASLPAVGLVMVFVLAACTSGAASLLGAATGAAGSPTGSATASGRVATPAASPAGRGTGQVPPSPSASGHQAQSGTIICGPVSATETVAICVPPAQEPLVVAAEKVLSAPEIAAAAGVTVDQGASMCAVVPPADCSGNPPIALVVFRRTAGLDPIRVLVWRESDGGLLGRRI